MARSSRPPKPTEPNLLARVALAIRTGNYRILPHARQRCTERDVAAADLENALETGHRVPARDRFDEPNASWSFCFEGKSVDGDALRVIVALEDRLLIVTVVRLGGDKED